MYTIKGKNTKHAIYSVKNYEQCDIVIYNKKYIFGLCPVSGTEHLKPLEFLSWWALQRCIC